MREVWNVRGDLEFRIIAELESVNGMMFECCKNSE